MITVYNAKPGITLEKLRKIKPTTPEGAGGRWCPIPHAELVETIRDEIQTRGWEVADMRLAVASSGQDMAGAIVFDKMGRRYARKMPDMNFSVGFLNSNARRRALKLTVGAEVTCCTNGLCTGELLLSRAHEHGVQLVDEVGEAFDRYLDAAEVIPATVAALRETELSQGEASDILLQAGHAALVGWKTVGLVDAEYRKPTFAEHGTGTAWALLNAFTYAARERINPVKQMEVFNKFRELLPMEVVA